MPQYFTSTTTTNTTFTPLISKPMSSVSGFEGFEKRLELRFHPSPDGLGLRRVHPDAIESVLRAVQCTVVSAVGNRYFDAYVLSESSLFVYPDKIIIKTCGTTHLLRSVPLLLRLGGGGAAAASCRYSRGAFLFPAAQPFPHTSFRNEVDYLNDCLPAALCYRKARSFGQSWHVYSASAAEKRDSLVTVEVCMTDMDRNVARKFFGSSGKEMTESAGINGIVPRAVVCDHAFDPCGYSMNGLDGDRYSTIHVTPEEGYSYASFECVAGGEREVAEAVARAAEVFRPGAMSVAVTRGGGVSGGKRWSAVAKNVAKAGLDCGYRASEVFPGAGVVTFQRFFARRK